MEKVNVNKVDTKKIELTTMQLYDDISVTTEIETLSEMETWAYKTEDDLAYDLFDTARAYEDGQTENLVPYSEDELNDIMVRAGLVANLFDDEDNDYGFNTHALCLAIIKYCIRFLDVLHGKYYCLELKTTKLDKPDTNTKRIDPNFDWNDF